MKKLFLLLLMTTACALQGAEWGLTPRLHVEGNHLADPDGNQVMLHGVMDTPSPYFSGYRFTDGQPINVYKDGDKYIDKCQQYFEELYTAITDTAQGSWCNVFRLHMDPCWTDDPNVRAAGFRESGNKVYDPSGQEVSGEASIYHFSSSRLSKYLDKLFFPLAKRANKHGMYVIMRPPGVCPHTIKVGDAYHKYLLTVWDIASKSYIAQNYSGWLSFELANEPIQILDANGQQSDHAMYDFFQPIVDRIRSNGFDGIIWVPGGTWQQDYKPYAIHPIQDDNFGYAVHFYPGWYSTSDDIHDPTTSIRAFMSSVPVVKTSPIMITEVDWSPVNPKGQGHYNESGQWVLPNYGTWATGSTSKFGQGYRAVLDYFGNIGMTITHTHDYMDIDHYRRTKVLRPAFTGAMPDTYEACSGACFQWYKEYAHLQHEAREWPTGGSSQMFPLDEYGFNPCIWETGSWDPATGKLVTGQYGFGGWQFERPLDLSEYKYLIVNLRQAAPNNGEWSASFRIFDKNNYWTEPYSYNLGGKMTAVIDLRNMKDAKGNKIDPSHIYIAGFWTLGGEGNGLYIESVFVSNDGVTPAGLEAITATEATPIGAWTLDGRPTSPSCRGITVRRLSDGSVRKVIVR